MGSKWLTYLSSTLVANGTRYIQQPQTAWEPGKTCWAVKAMRASLQIKTGSMRHYALSHRRKPSQGLALLSTVCPLYLEPFESSQVWKHNALGWVQARTPGLSFYFGNWPFGLSFLSSLAKGNGFSNTFVWPAICARSTEGKHWELQTQPPKGNPASQER